MISSIFTQFAIEIIFIIAGDRVRTMIVYVYAGIIPSLCFTIKHIFLFTVVFYKIFICAAMGLELPLRLIDIYDNGVWCATIDVQ